MADKHINKITPEDLKELKDRMWTKLIFGKDIVSFEEGQANLEKQYNKEQKENKKGAAERAKQYSKLRKEQADEIYLSAHSLGFVNSIKKWYYGDKKFNRLILEKRDTNA